MTIKRSSFANTKIMRTCKIDAIFIEMALDANVEITKDLITKIIQNYNI